MDFIYENDRIFLKDQEGQIVAEIDFPEVSAGVVDINRTFVDSSLRGQGIAGKLMDAVVLELEKENLKALTSCSYAEGWFKKHPERAGLLAINGWGIENQ